MYKFNINRNSDNNAHTSNDSEPWWENTGAKQIEQTVVIWTVLYDQKTELELTKCMHLWGPLCSPIFSRKNFWSKVTSDFWRKENENVWHIWCHYFVRLWIVVVNRLLFNIFGAWASNLKMYVLTVLLISWVTCPFFNCKIVFPVPVTH